MKDRMVDPMSEIGGKMNDLLIAILTLFLAGASPVFGGGKYNRQYCGS